MRYADAIKRILDPASDLTQLPEMGSQGAINVVHFLLSSLREVSGWSTMTGRLSTERFEVSQVDVYVRCPSASTLSISLQALKTSMASLECQIRARDHPGVEEEWLIVEATWEIAMLDTMFWSLSHIGGVVENSLDAALATA
jgi:hypothetical protein